MLILGPLTVSSISLLSSTELFDEIMSMIWFVDYSFFLSTAIGVFLRLVRKRLANYFV